MFNLKFKTGNDAFSNGNKENEIARILNKVITQVDNGDDEGKIIDINGNKIGEWSIDKFI